MALLIEAVDMSFGEVGHSYTEEVVATKEEVGAAVIRALQVPHDAIIVRATEEEPHPLETHEQAEARRYREYRGLPTLPSCQYFDSVTALTCDRTPVVATVTYRGVSQNQVCEAHANFYRNLGNSAYQVSNIVEVN